MSGKVVRSLRGISDTISLFGAALAVGDSTAAYCVDRAREMSRLEMWEMTGDERGANLYPEACSGEAPLSFPNHAGSAGRRDFSYDRALLLGGWNSQDISCDAIAMAFRDLFAYYEENLIRK